MMQSYRMRKFYDAGCPQKPTDAESGISLVKQNAADASGFLRFPFSGQKNLTQSAHDFLYCSGVSPVLALKNLWKVEVLGKFSLETISLTGRSEYLSMFFASRMT